MKGTSIEWADDTVNGQMGCDGCELYSPANPQAATCYAKLLVDRYAGLKGWPEAFDKPALFPGRIEKACKWKDLTGTERPDKPWLNGLPRMIFLDDLGDTFTESLPIDWLLPLIPVMEASPHIWLMLTKRPRRMAEFFGRLGRVPANIWPGTSVTGKGSLRRIDDLLSIDRTTNHWVSVEPLWDDLDLTPYLYTRYEMGGARSMYNELAWVIVGGESGVRPKATDLDSIRRVVLQTQTAKKAAFVKQLGSQPFTNRICDPCRVRGPRDAGENRCQACFETGKIMDTLHLRSRKGGDWSEWPEDLRVREFPEVSNGQA